MDEGALRAVVGHRFPGGSFTIAPYEHWLTCDAVGAPPTREGDAHPMYAYYAALGGMGIDLDALFAIVGATADDGPMFGEAAIDLIGTLEVGRTYDVTGAITEVVRKSGRRAGVFDIVTFVLEVRADDDLVATSTNSFVFPRRDVSAPDAPATPASAASGGS